MSSYRGSSGEYQARDSFTYQCECNSCTHRIWSLWLWWSWIEKSCLSQCLTQQRLAHQLGSSLLLQEAPVPRPYDACWNTGTCYSAMFPIQGIQYSQACRRIIGYQVGHLQTFFDSGERTINERYVDGAILTNSRSPQQHIWTFVNEFPHSYISRCQCTNDTKQRTINVLSFVGNYFCEIGVPPDQGFNSYTFYADDLLWNGQGCGPTNTCCTFNNPPWFCKQLPQSINASLEVRLCS